MVLNPSLLATKPESKVSGFFMQSRLHKFVSLILSFDTIKGCYVNEMLKRVKQDSISIYDLRFTIWDYSFPCVTQLLYFLLITFFANVIF